MFVPEIEVKHVCREYSEGRSNKKILDDISFSINEHEFVCVLGPSGCGKSTLLRIVAGLDTATQGKVFFRGRDITAPNPKTSAMIFQTFALLPWRTVYENIELGLQSVGIPKAKRRPIVTKYIHLMELDDFSDAYPYELSGGMKQRVGIARALAVEPCVLLMDEPFSALDTMTANQLRRDVLDIWNDSQTVTNTFLMITHLIEEAVLMADRVIVLSKRPGKVIGDIPIDIPRPRYDHERDPEFYEMCDMIRRMISYNTGETGERK